MSAILYVFSDTTSRLCHLPRLTAVRPRLGRIRYPLSYCSRRGAGAALKERLTRVPEPDCDAVVVGNLFRLRLSALPEKSTGNTVEIGR